MKLSLSEISENLNAFKTNISSNNLKEIVTYYFLDSREIEDNINLDSLLYFALKGERVDASSFIPSLIERGVKNFVLSFEHFESFTHYFERDGSLTFFFVFDVKVALQNLAKYVIKKSNFKRIAITGSNGKTSTKELLAAMLEKKYITYKSYGNLNSDIGLPLSILRVEGNEDYAIFEVGINYIGEMEVLESILKPEIVIITNIGAAHLEAFKTLDIVRDEKSKIIGSHTKILIISESEPCFDYIKAKFESQLKILPVNINDFKLQGFNLSHNNEFISKFSYKDEEYKVKFLGIHNIYNALLCINLALTLKVESKLIREALFSIKLPSGRMELFQKAEHLVLNDSYNSNLSSFTALKDFIISFENLKKQKILILGSFKEQGDFSYEAHKSALLLINELKFDKVFIIGEEFLSTLLNEDFIIDNSCYFKEFNFLAEEFKKNLDKDSFIVLKGSRSNQLERILKYIN